MSIPADVRSALEEVVISGKLAEAILAKYPEPDPDPIVQEVPPDGNLQAALNDGPLTIKLAPGHTYQSAGFEVTRSGTVLLGNGAALKGTLGPALWVPPGVADVRVESLLGTSEYSSVFAVGDNGHPDLSTVPQRITFSHVHVPTHRGRRGFELHGADVQLLDCSVRDTWDPALGDSQGVWINNGPGPYLIRGGLYQAASENILVGGASTGIPGLIPADIVIEQLELSKPLVWKTDGVTRAVKNLLELKTGQRVAIRDLVMTGSWKDAQDGYAFVLTPRSGGSVGDVVIERCRVREVSSLLQLTGHDEPHKPATPARTTGIVVRDVTAICSQVAHGGRGILALLGMGPDTLDFERVVAVVDGTSLILGGDKERVGRLRMNACYANLPKYGIFGAGLQNLTSWETWLDALDIAGCTFAGGAASFKAAAPANTYVTRAEFDVMVAPKLA